MLAQEIKDFAEGACELLGIYHGMVEKQASEIESLRAMHKKASAPIEFDEALLKKASKAFHDFYGAPSNFTPEQIGNYWKANPKSMVNSIIKLATEQSVQSRVSGSDLGAPVFNKKASADVEELSAEEELYRKYSNN